MTRNRITLDEAVDLTRTGDLWLFRGRSAADNAIRLLTNAPVNHVGMAVVLDDLPPLMWHAELGKGLRDVWTGSHHRGVQLHDLREAVGQWTGRYAQRAWLRQLETPVTRVMEVRARRVGGAHYQVPVEVPQRRARTLAVRWIVTYSRDRREKHMADKLANEILDALNQQGGAFKRKDDLYRMAQANKAFSHYRW